MHWPVFIFRAHAVFTVTIEQRERQSSKVGVRSIIHMVDAAGVEHVASSDANVVAGYAVLYLKRIYIWKQMMFL